MLPPPPRSQLAPPPPPRWTSPRPSPLRRRRTAPKSRKTPSTAPRSPGRHSSLPRPAQPRPPQTPPPQTPPPWTSSRTRTSWGRAAVWVAVGGPSFSERFFWQGWVSGWVGGGGAHGFQQIPHQVFKFLLSMLLKYRTFHIPFRQHHFWITEKKPD